MGTTADKLSYLNGTKKKLRYSLNKIGADITLDTTFFDYLLLLIDINEKNYYEQIKRDSIHSIRGVTTVDGEPSPDNPADVYGITGNYRYDIDNMLYTIDLSELELNGINDYYDEIYMGSGYNLFDKDNANILNNTYLNNGQSKISSGNGNKVLYISIEGGKTYTISKIASSRFAIATTSVLPSVNVSTIDKEQNNSATRLTLTTSSNAKYLCIFYLYSGDTINEQTILDSIQIEEGPTKNEYEPYNAKGKWLLRKNVGKVVLDGTENINYRGDGRFDIEIPSSSGSYAILGVCDYYSYTNDWNAHTNTNGTFTIQNINWGANKCRMSFKNTNYSSLSDVRAGLSSNNIKVYYQITSNIGAPTITEITRENYPKLYESLQKISPLTTFISQYWIDL